ncbi:MAG TPA: hypothetical protein P5081_23305 [Phycisphaerae bacterium]|nr:hypothetical protein [Phycisphaerae bacterium]HRW55810.1 hypothetical protein [Phycisphaerae bacterium]
MLAPLPQYVSVPFHFLNCCLSYLYGDLFSGAAVAPSEIVSEVLPHPGAPLVISSAERIAMMGHARAIVETAWPERRRHVMEEIDERHRALISAAVLCVRLQVNSDAPYLVATNLTDTLERIFCGEAPPQDPTASDDALSFDAFKRMHILDRSRRDWVDRGGSTDLARWMLYYLVDSQMPALMAELKKDAGTDDGSV